MQTEAVTNFIMLINLGLRQYAKYSNILKIPRRLCSVTTTPNENTDNSSDPKTGGFAKAYEKQSQILKQEDSQDLTFPALLRNSKLIDVSSKLSFAYILPIHSSYLHIFHLYS